MIKFRDVQKSIITLLRAFNIHVSLRIERRISDLNERKRERERTTSLASENEMEKNENRGQHERGSSTVRREVQCPRP